MEELGGIFRHDDGIVFREKDDVREYWAPGELVHPLGSSEILTAVGGIYETFNTVQAIWLKSKVPIETEDVVQALEILARQIPHLQFCIARVGIGLWFKRMEEFVFDFEVSNEEVMDVYEKMLETKFDLWRGPLWNVKMVIPNANDQCAGPESGYSFVLIFTIQHVITDGFTNMKVCREFVSILNQLKAGKIVNPKPTPLVPISDDSLYAPQPYFFFFKYAFKKFSKCLFSNFAKVSSFDERLPIPKTNNFKTKILYDELTLQETKNLMKLCKDFKITINTCTVTTANFALLEVAQSKSILPMGEKTINVIHCVNTRRYFPPEYIDSSGCHISFIEDECKMSLSNAKNFWNEAKKIQENMKQHLEVEKNHMKILPLVCIMAYTFPLNSYLTRNGYCNRTDCHYTTTNMGNLKEILPGPKEGDAVEITNVRRSVSGSTFGYPFLLTFHTFRDKLMMSIDYSTNKMEDETAHLFFKTFCHFMKNLAIHGTIYDFNNS